MRTRYAVGLIGFLILLMFGSVSWSKRIMAQPDPPVAGDRAAVIGAPAPMAPGDCCLWQLGKKAEGTRQARFGAPYRCETGPTARGDAVIKLALNTSGAPCDQIPTLIPNGSVLQARGVIIRRADGFAHFEGPFTIHNPAGRPLFDGTMTTIDRIGTHHAPFGPEVCNQENHLEGFLNGRGSTTSGLQAWQIRAFVVAKAALPPAGGSLSIVVNIDGDLMKCP